VSVIHLAGFGGTAFKSSAAPPKHQYKQVCVKPPSSTLKKTLPAFAAERGRPQRPTDNDRYLLRAEHRPVPVHRPNATPAVGILIRVTMCLTVAFNYRILHDTMNQIDLQHGTNNLKVENRKTSNGYAQKQIRRPPLLLSIDGTDIWKVGWTDTRPLHRPCSAYHAGTINKTIVCTRGPIYKISYDLS